MDKDKTMREPKSGGGAVIKRTAAGGELGGHFLKLRWRCVGSDHRHIDRGLAAFYMGRCLWRTAGCEDETCRCPGCSCCDMQDDSGNPQCPGKINGAFGPVKEEGMNRAQNAYV